MATAIAVLSTLLAAAAIPASPARADAATDLAEARRAADAAAERWFDAQVEARVIEADIARLEEELSGLRARSRASAGVARARAVTLYRNAASADDVASMLEGADIMDAARRTELLERVTERSREDLDRYERLVHDTKARLAELAERRADQTATVERLRADDATLQRELARAQAAYQREQRARAEAEAAAARAAAANDTGPDGTAGSNSSGGSATPDRPTSPETPNHAGGSGGDEPVPVEPPAPPEPGQHPHHGDPFLSCVRQRESRGIYTAVNPAGYYGAYQFAPGTWNATASHAGRPGLIGVRPDRAAPWDQDDLAWTLYQWQGMGPWGGGCG